MSSAPSITVILSPRNAGSRLEPALASVWEQKRVALEVVVIDRGSTDGTRDVLEAQRRRFAALEYAGDIAPYAALNRALASARGEWVCFFSSEARFIGDLILSEVLNWASKTEAGVLCGECAYDNGLIEKLRGHVNPLAGDFVPRSATFYRRGLFEENGNFDESLPAMAGYEFNVRIWKNRIRFKPIPLRVAACSSRADRPRGWSAAREKITVRHRYAPGWRCAWWDVVSVLGSLAGSVSKNDR